MKRDRLGRLGTGLGLIGLGVALLVAVLIGWDRFWPVFPLLGGLAFFAGYMGSGFKDSGLAFVGTAAVLIGVFFFGFSLGYWEWAEMERLWPVFPLIGGIAFFVLFLAEGRRRDWGALGVGLAAVVVGAVGLAITHDLMGTDVVKYWPALIVFVGLTGLVGGVVRLFRRG